MKRGLLLVFLFLYPASLFALPRDARRPRTTHMIMTAEHTLLDSDRAELARLGCIVLRPIGARDYVVTVREENLERVASSINVAALRAIEPIDKIFRSARREAIQLRPWAELQILFHDDVSFEEALRLLRDAGGVIDDPLTVDFGPLRRIAARIPDERIDALASHDAVFQIHGSFGRIDLMNKTAAMLSDVDDVHIAPYDLSGRGVTVAVMDYGESGPATADAAHPEFEGRVTRNGTQTVDLHPTHVTGTIAAKGINADAKGMAPGVAVQNFAWTSRYLEIKENDYTRLGVKADNNSIGFVSGWSTTDRTHLWEWWGDELFGAYTESAAALDSIAIRTKVIMAWAAGNDNNDSGPNPNDSLFKPHYHQTGVEDDPTVFCVTVNGSGTDCPSNPCNRCERTSHPPDGPYRTMSRTAAAKNVLGVGAVSGATKDEQGRPVIASFSSRGPTQDGRIKPDIVAKGTFQLSTANGGGYQRLQGTSMSTPVITGIVALILEQLGRTFGTAPADPALIRALLANGADDLGLAGPDYTYGFGLANARRTVDTILADGGSGSRIRRDSVTHGVVREYPLSLGATSDLKLTVAWNDPENTPYAVKTLINDLDLKLIGPGGNEILPYRLDPAAPEIAATRGVNTFDNMEQIEVKNAAAGAYKVRVVGTSIPSSNPQEFVLVSNATLGGGAVQCIDPFEPNDTPETAWGRLNPDGSLMPAFCSQTDVDHFRFTVDRSGPVVITVKATDTPIRVTLSPAGIAPITATAEIGSSATVQTNVGPGVDQPIAPVVFLVKVEPAGDLGDAKVYTIRSSYRSSTPNRVRPARR